MNPEALQEVFGCFQTTLGNDNAARTAAVARLEQMVEMPNFLVGLFQIIVSADAPFNVRHSASIFFKNKTVYRWSGSKGQNIPEEEKTQIRENIVEALIHVPVQMRLPLEDVLHEIIQTDFARGGFQSLVPKIQQYITATDPQTVYGGVLALKILADNFSMKPSEKRGPFDEVIMATFPQLQTLLAALVGGTTRESAEVQRMILKIYWSGFQMVNPAFLQDPNVFGGWMNEFLKILMFPIPVDQQPQPNELPIEKERNIWWKLKKTCSEILTRYMSRYGNPKLAAPAYVNFAAFFEKNVSVVILIEYMKILQAHFNGEYIARPVMLQIVQYIEYSVRQSVTWKQLKPNIGTLYDMLIFPLLCFSEEDGLLWVKDPTEYVRKNFNLFEDFFDPATAAINLLVELVKVRTKACLNHIVGTCLQKLDAYAAQQTQQTSFEKYGALQTLSAISMKLISSKIFGSKLETMMLTHVFPEFQNPNGFMRAIACKTIEAFADVAWTSPDNYARALLFVRDCMKDPELPVRVTAATSLQGVMAKVDHDLGKQVLLPQLPAVLDDFFGMMNEVENDDLVSALEALIDVFGTDIAPVAVNLATRLVEQFFRLLALDDDDYEDAGLAACNCIRAIVTLVDSVSEIPELYVDLEVACLPLICRLTNSAAEGIDFYEDVLEMVSTFTFFNPNGISANMWNVYALMYQAVTTWACDYLREMLPCIRNYIVRGQEVFLTADDGKAAKMTFNIVNQILSEPRYGEDTANHAAKLCEVVLTCCKGAVDDLVTPFIQLALNRLGSAKTWAFRVMLFEIICNCVIYNPVLSVSVLEGFGCVGDAFNVHAQLAPHFHRMNDKKICVMAIFSLLKIPVEQMPPSLVALLPKLVGDACMQGEDLLKQVLEFEDALRNQSNSDDDEFWGDDDGIDDELDMVSAEDANYLKMLQENASKYARIMNGTGEDFGGPMDTDQFDTPLDDINEFVFMMQTLQQFSADNPQAFQTLMGAVGPPAHTALENIRLRAEQDLNKPADAAQ